MVDRIKFWRPFYYSYIDYDGRSHVVTFTCPSCQGHNCQKLNSSDPNFFWSGHFRCSDCGETLENGEPLCYFSKSFSNNLVKRVVQLELF